MRGAAPRRNEPVFRLSPRSALLRYSSARRRSTSGRRRVLVNRCSFLAWCQVCQEGQKARAVLFLYGSFNRFQDACSADDSSLPQSYGLSQARSWK